LPEQIEKEWLGVYLYQLGEEKKVRRQIKELKEILDQERIPFMLLKGASAMMRLYPQPGLRTFCDLDILIPSDKVAPLKAAMTAAGYKPLNSRNSPEDEVLRNHDSHLDPFIKEGQLMVEAHLNLVGGRGRQEVTLREVWDAREESSLDGVEVCHLGKEHFLIHTLVKYLVNRDPLLTSNHGNPH